MARKRVVSPPAHILQFRDPGITALDHQADVHSDFDQSEVMDSMPDRTAQ